LVPPPISSSSYEKRKATSFFGRHLERRGITVREREFGKGQGVGFHFFNIPYPSDNYVKI